MKKKSKKKQHLCILLFIAFLTVGFMLPLNNESVVSAKSKPIYIGTSGKVKIYIDEEIPERYLIFTPPSDGVMSFRGSGGKLFEAVRLTHIRGNYYVYYPPLRGADLLNVDNPNRCLTYGVKKGVQYALNVKCVSNYTIKYSFKSVKESGGKKQSRAQTIKKGKKQFGLLPHGKKQTKWYKFKVPKTKTVTLEFSGWSNQYLGYKIKVKGMKTVIRNTQKNNLALKNDKGTVYNRKPKKMKAKLKKGTVVYIGVFTRSKNNSGYYYVKWK